MSTTPVSIEHYLSKRPYPGRGILVGMHPDGKSAVLCYFIMGRSPNSRNRVFVPKENDICIEPQDPAKVEDPSLIVYWPLRHLKEAVVVTNGDQTDTIVSFLNKGSTFENALASRTYEPDAPHFTSRISGIFWTGASEFSYQLSILKKQSETTEGCARMVYTYQGEPGVGHLIHTYALNTDPLPSFSGEPIAVTLEKSIKEIGEGIWRSLDEDNKISLIVQSVDLVTGDVKSLLYNKYKK